MKKLIFLGFILTAACAVQNELANGNTITPPESENAGILPDPSAQTTRDEWIQLVRGRVIIDTTTRGYFRDNGDLGPANASKLYKFCDVANGQNKAIYSIQSGFVGFEIKNNTLYIYSENYNLGNGWVNSNQIIFDQNNPLVSTESYILN